MKRFVTAITLFACTILIGSLSPAHAREDDRVMTSEAPDAFHLSKKQVKRLEATAETPADHMKLATWYNHQADKLEAEARGHEDLANTYANTPAVLGSKSSIPNKVGAEHCRNEAKSLRKTAGEDRALATEHEEMAKEAER